MMPASRFFGGGTARHAGNAVRTGSVSEGAVSSGADEWFSINYCIEGRCETDIPHVGVAVVGESDVCVSFACASNGKFEPPRSFRYPLARYVGIARALALEPEILVCDEATSALDVSVQGKVVELLAKLQKEKGISILFICHDLALVALLTHRVVVMYLGNVVEILRAKDLPKAKHPYTQALMKSVFPLQPKGKADVQLLRGEIPSPLDVPKGCPFQNRCDKCMPVCKEKKPARMELSEGHIVACHLFAQDQEETKGA